MTAGRLYTVAGTGVCGTAGQGGPAAQAQLWNPEAVTVDPAGDLLVADSGDQSVLLASAGGGMFYGTAVGAGDIGVVVGGTGSYGPYLADGFPATAWLPRSTTPAAWRWRRMAHCSSPMGSCTSSASSRPPRARCSAAA